MLPAKSLFSDFQNLQLRSKLLSDYRLLLRRCSSPPGTMLAAVAASCAPSVLCSAPPAELKSERRFGNVAGGFPAFLPKEVEKIRDSHAVKLAKRIERLPVPVMGSESCIMSSCVRPSVQGTAEPVVLLHGFDSSCLEWRYSYPLLEDAGVESWAVDILGWGFSDLGLLPSCDSVSKREHLFQFWKSYIKRPIVLVGPSLGAAVAIDFAVNHPEAVSKLVLIDASVYAEGTGDMATLPRLVAYAGASLLRSFLLRFYALGLTFKELPLSTRVDWVNIGRLHCLLPWWKDATVNFMESGGYSITPLINQVKQKTLIIWGEDDQIISNKLAVRLHCEMQDAILRQIAYCGHLPHVEKPGAAAELIIKFVQNGYC